MALEQNARVEELDAAARRVRLRDGRTLALRPAAARDGQPRAQRSTCLARRYPACITCARSPTSTPSPRRSPPGARVLLVGAGYIGFEVAAVARQRGFDVTVLEAAERVMSRAVSVEVSAFYEARASRRGRGDSLRRGRQGAARHDPRDCGRDRRRPTVPVRRRDRRHRHRAQRRARGCARGCPAANGIVVDEFARTADPHIVAAGDCTNHPHPLLERRVRLESVPNAIHQAKVAAATLLGTPVAYSEVPWFWSDQYDLKLQIAGLSAGYDEVVLRGDPARAQLRRVLSRAPGELLAVDAINSPREFIAGKKLVANRARIAPDVLRDAERRSRRRSRR